MYDLDTPVEQWSPTPLIAHPSDVEALLDATRVAFRTAVHEVSVQTARVTDLCVMRESNRNAYADAEGLIAQLAGIFSDLPGIRAVKKLGIKPLTKLSGETTGPVYLKVTELDENGKSRTSKIRVDLIEESRSTRAALFSYRGVYYLYSLSSAGTLNEMGRQEWTTLLIKVIWELRPVNLRTVNVSRYVRNQDVAGLLLHAMTRCVDTVHLGGLPLQMSGPRSGADKLVFTMLATAAAFERDWIVSRLVAGKLTKLQAGRWTFGPRTVPLGYRLDEAKRLVVDPSQKELVEQVLLLIASNPAPKQFVRALGRLGVKLQPLPKHGLPARSARHTMNPHQKMKQYLALLPLWMTGQHIVRLPNPFPGAEELAGTKVLRGRGGRDEVPVVLSPGVPEGGWADDEVLLAALAVAMERSGEVDDIPASLAAQLNDPTTHAKVKSRMDFREPKGTKARRALPWSGTRWGTKRFRSGWTMLPRDTRPNTDGGYTLLRWTEEDR